MFRILVLSFVISMLTCVPLRAADETPETETAEPVSFYRQIRPILQRECAGCHQPVKKGGDLLLTSFEQLQKGGENGAGSWRESRTKAC